MSLPPPPSMTPSMGQLTPMPTDTSRGVFLAVQGLEGGGKTDFAFSAPAPIMYINLDGGNWRRVRERDVYKEKEIYITQIDSPTIPENSDTNYVENMLKPVWMKTKQAILTSIENPMIRTIVLDKHNTAWGLARLAHLGKIKGVKSQHYDEVNADFRNLLLKMSNSSKIIILIGSEGDEYIEGNKTGRLKREGFKEIGERVEDQIRCFREEGQFFVTMLNSKTRPSLDNKVWKQPSCSFTDIALELFPNSLPTDWL